MRDSNSCAKVLLFSERYFANVIILCNFAVEDCTGGQQYSFFDGILAFAIRHARWNVGNFNKVHLINENSERPHTRGRYLSFITALPTAATRTGFVHALRP